jgi:hypothetical protein
MILRRIAIFFALLMGLLASQVPEYAQQYAQRLGGAIAELKQVVADFDMDAAREGLTHDGGIAHLRESPDRFVQGRGMQMEDITARLQSLIRQRERFEQSGPIGRLKTLALEHDGRVAQGAFDDFQPAVPVTLEGLILALFGFCVGGGLIHLLGLPFHRGRKALHARKDPPANMRI